jgi:hypothetical protein
MNHQPFEDWLLEERTLNPEEQRDLQTHLQTCRACAALAEVTLSLHNVQSAAPVPGFTRRFELRLERARNAQRRRQAIGVLILALGAFGLSSWYTYLTIVPLLQAPIPALVGAFNGLLFWLEAIGRIWQVAEVVLRVASFWITDEMWAIAAFILAGASLSMLATLEKTTYLPQGVKK